MDGGPVNGKNLPETIRKFLNSTAPGEYQSRQLRMAAIWKQRYNADLSNDATLCSLNYEKPRSPAVIQKRILLLWSLHTFVQEFDDQLLALLEIVRETSTAEIHQKATELSTTMLPADVADATRLLKIDSQTALMLSLRGDKEKKPQITSLEIEILQQVLWGTVNIQTAIDKIDSELNYSFDVVLAQLLSQRNKIQQRITELNFVNKGTLNAIGGLLDLKDLTKAADEVFVSANGTGIGLSSLALVAARGGKRKVDTTENSLADFFKLETNSTNHLPPLVTDFLNSSDPAFSDGRTRKESLIEIWRQNKVSTMNPEIHNNQQRLAALSRNDYDTIKVVTNRIALLQSLRVKIASLNAVLLHLLQATGHFETPVEQDCYADSQRLSRSARSMAALIGVHLVTEKTDVHKSISQLRNDRIIEQQISLLRRVLTAVLEVKTTSANIDIEIARETQTLSRMTRARDLAVTLTNNANFYQGYILSTILYGPLGLSAAPRHAVYADRIKIISGFLSIGLGAASLLERHGGIRLSSVEPNMLGPCFGLKSSAERKYSAIVWKFLNFEDSNPGTQMTRKEELIAYWKQTKLLKLNFDKRSTLEKVSATGRSHHQINESIKLITNRASMLYDLRAVINLMNPGLGALLHACDCA